MAWFETWFDTEYYHLLYNNRNHAEADAFVEKLFAAGVLSAGMHVLELACGKGRHAAAMHRLGARVLGVDLSANSIAAAQALAAPGLSFAVHDMRRPLPGQAHGYDAVTNLFTSLGYFDDEADNARVLQNVAAALRPGGTFVLDFLNTAPTLRNLKPTHTELRGPVRFDITKRYEGGKIIKTISVNEGGNTAGPFVEQVQALAPADLVRLCQGAGLQVVAQYGDYHLHALEVESSARCILVCKAP